MLQSRQRRANLLGVLLDPKGLLDPKSPASTLRISHIFYPQSTSTYAADLRWSHPAAQRQQRRLDYQVLLAMQRPETSVTEHELADLVHCFPDDSVSQVCNVFAQYARQHDQEQPVRAWAEQLLWH